MTLHDPSTLWIVNDCAYPNQNDACDCAVHLNPGIKDAISCPEILVIGIKNGRVRLPVKERS